jgi:hypothetical protein
MQTESFGTGLRAQRERRSVTLAAISAQTKIKVALLEGLERDDLSRWPQGIFRKAYVRSYAAAVGLDPDVVVRQFLEVYPEPVEPSPEEERPPTGLQYLFGRLRNGEHAEPRRPRETASDIAHAASARRVEPTAELTEASRGVPALGLERRLTELAALCTKLGRAVARPEIAAALEDMVKVLDAVGVILWVWDSRRKAWAGALAQGYPDDFLSQLPVVASDADNAIGAAFRSGDTQVVAGTGSSTGAVVAPLMTPNGCAGMLAFELSSGRERGDIVRAVATILAAQLAGLISVPGNEGSCSQPTVPLTTSMPAAG